MSKEIETFSFTPPSNFVKEGKWLLAATSFDAPNSFLNITDENNSFPITIPEHCETKSAERTIDQLIKLLELRSQNCIELLHLKEVRKRGY